MTHLFPLKHAYRTYGVYDPPGPGINSRSGPLANHNVNSSSETNEIDYPVQSGYAESMPMYEAHQIPPLRIATAPEFAPVQPVAIGQPPPTVTLPPPPQNHVLDYNRLQGTNNPTDLTHQVLRDINYRYVTIQNSSYRPVGVGITTYYTGTVPEIRFIVQPQIIRYLGINSQGGPAQFLWPLDPESGQPVGSPEVLSAHANDFVLRDGINGWNVQNFSRPSYRAAF